MGVRSLHPVKDKGTSLRKQWGGLVGLLEFDQSLERGLKSCCSLYVAI